MPECEEAVYSNEYFDFVVSNEYADELEGGDYCIQELSNNYQAVYYQMEENGEKMRLQNFSYHVIPKCFGLLNNEVLGETGILKVRDQPNLSLTGRGVLLGFIDTEERV